MTQVISFVGYTPIARFDDLPWTTVRIEEGDTADGPWTQIDELTLDPVDSDPSDPAARDFTTELASDTPLLWYRVVFADATDDTETPTDPIQNTGSPTTYGSIAELARLLKINNPTAAQTAAMQRVLSTATGEIDSEIDLSDDADALAGWQLSLAGEVCLERAVELWRAAPFGIVGIDSDIGGVHTSKNTWERYAHMLAPLKSQWGFA